MVYVAFIDIGGHSLVEVEGMLDFRDGDGLYVQMSFYLGVLAWLLKELIVGFAYLYFNI